MDIPKIKETHNKCAEILNQSDLTAKEMVVALAQLLIYTGQAITKKEIDIREADLDQLYKEYYANNKENDMGLGLILNGASIMSALTNIKGNETANKENLNDNQISTTA
jgi:uncharacterized protein YvpB